MGSLTVVGLGPGRPEWTTLEAADVLRTAAANPAARAYGFPPARDLAAAVAPGLTVLDPRDAVPPADPPSTDGRGAYSRLVEALLLQAFAEGLDVLYLATGNALVINDLVLLLRRACHRYRKPLRLVAGLSFLDVVLERVFWHADRGLQLLSAWSVAAGEQTVEPQAPALLYELGEHVDDAGGSDPTTRELLRRLHAQLSRTFPADHGLLLLYSSGPPGHSPEARPLPLDALPSAAVPPNSNLWVPSVGGPAAEREAATPQGAKP